MTLPEPHIMIRWAYGGYIVDYELPAPEKKNEDDRPENEVGTAIFSAMPPVLKLVDQVLAAWTGPTEKPDKVSDIVKPPKRKPR